MDTLTKVLKDLSGGVAEADTADEYVEALEAVRDKVKDGLKKLDEAVKKEKGADRLKLLKNNRDGLAVYLEKFEETFKNDPLAKHKGFG